MNGEWLDVDDEEPMQSSEEENERLFNLILSTGSFSDGRLRRYQFIINADCFQTLESTRDQVLLIIEDIINADPDYGSVGEDAIEILTNYLYDSMSFALSVGNLLSIYLDNLIGNHLEEPRHNDFKISLEELHKCLKMYVWRQQELDNDDKDNWKTTTTGCLICLEEFVENESEVASMSCEHIFHRGCLLTWAVINPCCPTCRFVAIDDVDDEDEDQEEEEGDEDEDEEGEEEEEEVEDDDEDYREINSTRHSVDPPSLFSFFSLIGVCGFFIFCGTHFLWVLLTN